MWPILILTMRNCLGSKKLLWPTLIGLFSVVTDEPVEFEKQPIQNQDFKRITN